MKNNRFRLLGLALLCLTALLFAGSRATAQPAGPSGGRRGGPPRYELGQILPSSVLEELDLSPQQRAELNALSADLKSKLEQLLTAEQKQRIDNQRPDGPRGEGRPEGRRSPPNSPPPGRDAERPDSTAPAEVKQFQSGKLKELPHGVTRTPVVFTGGYETDQRDHGRPVILIAAALGVTPEIFREAFSRVRPASGGREPEPAQVRQNKSVLMAALAKHGITNERLDEVSNFYRYPPGSRSLWKHKPATANALIKEGTIIGYEIVDGGYGYTSTPSVSVPKRNDAAAQVELAYGKSFEANGSVAAISIPKGNGH